MSLTSKFKPLKQALAIKPSARYYRAIYIDKSTTDVKIDKNEKVDLILSPAFYWVRREKLPVRYEFQAKKLLAGIFDGILSEGTYSYMAHKADGENLYMVYAYDESYISSFLDKLKIDDSQIHSIYFAQSELSDKGAIKIDDKNALIEHEGILVSILLSVTKDAKDIQSVLDSSKRSRHQISINRYASLYNSLPIKSLNTVAAVLILFIVLYIAELVLNKNSLKELYVKSIEIKREYHLPSTSFELKSLKRSLHKLASKEESIRESVEFVLNLPLKDKEHVRSLELKNLKLTIEVSLTEPKRAEEIKNYWKRKLNIKSMKVKESILTAKIDIGDKNS